MSFGWSAGDIATAVTVVYNLIQALDDVDGAAGNYREAISFLRDLKRTLEPLQVYTAWNKFPEYGKDVTDQVAHIKEPLEEFLAAALKFEPSLGNSKAGRHRHVFRKLQWHLIMSKKTLTLKKKIESHMRVIDTLLQRLTLDIVQALPENLRTTFQEILGPELIPVLRENLRPLHTTLLDYHKLHAASYENLLSKISEDYQILSSGVEEIKQGIQSSKATQNRIEYCLRGGNPKDKELPALPCPKEQNNSATSLIDENPMKSIERVQESLCKVYYMVFLYLGHFLQNLFLVLSRMVQPSRALVPVLLAKYNISFLDAIGRPPRVLPYEYFRSFKVLQAFIEHEFKDLPGAAWVNRGRYLVMGLGKNQALDEGNWSHSVVPGSTVMMSMVIQRLLDASTPEVTRRCPESSCSGAWPRSNTVLWVTCPVCHKEVLDSLMEVPLDEEKVHDQVKDDNLEISPPKEHATQVKRTDLDESDISLFKRIVHQTLDRKLKSLRYFEEESSDIPMDLDEYSDVSGSSDEDLIMRRKPVMIRNKSGSLVKPALRPRSRTPGAPTFSKSIHFDSHLEHVRHFLQVDRPIAISAGEPDPGLEDGESDFPFAERWTSEKEYRSQRMGGRERQFPKEVYPDTRSGISGSLVLENIEGAINPRTKDFDYIFWRLPDEVDSSSRDIHPNNQNLQNQPSQPPFSVISSPPDSADNSDDDEYQSNHGRRSENLVEIREYIRKILPHRSASPTPEQQTSHRHTASQITPLTTEQTIVDERRADDRLEEALKNLGLD